jgi:hypothetical protein
VIDETSCLKKGDRTPGVQRQYLGCAGKVDNGIVTVHVGAARGTFQALLDADLYLPKSWAEDRARCRAAGIPDDVRHLPKWRIALDQLLRLAGNGVRFDWLTFDEGYGAAVPFLTALNPTRTEQSSPDEQAWGRFPPVSHGLRDRNSGAILGSTQLPAGLQIRPKLRVRKTRKVGLARTRQMAYSGTIRRNSAGRRFRYLLPPTSPVTADRKRPGGRRVSRLTALHLGNNAIADWSFLEGLTTSRRGT